MLGAWSNSDDDMTREYRSVTATRRPARDAHRAPQAPSIPASGHVERSPHGGVSR